MAADLWYPGAVYRGPTRNEGDGDGTPGEAADRDVESRGLVVHIAEGTYEGTISWQRNDASDVSSEFVVARDGRVAQMMPVNDAAWTQRAGNGHWDAVECEGFSTGPLTAQQVEAIARLYAWGHGARGWPLQLATSPAGSGLGHHSMGTNGRSVPTDTWTGPTWGHELCPGPQIYAQKPAILARAIEIANGDDMSEQDVADIKTRLGGIEGTLAWLAWRGDALAKGLDEVAGGPGKKEEMWTVVTLKDLLAKAAAPVPVTVDAATVADALAADPALADRIAEAVAAKLAARLAQ